MRLSILMTELSEMVASTELKRTTTTKMRKTRLDRRRHEIRKVLQTLPPDLGTDKHEIFQVLGVRTLWQGI